MKLLPHQELAVDFLLTRKRCILADQPRLGKTFPTVMASAQHLPVLVVCPAIVKTVWQTAFKKCAGLDSTVVTGRAGAMKLPKIDVVIINYDLIQYVPVEEFERFKTLVLDESHRIKNPEAKRTKAALWAMEKIPRVYALSGTPIPNRPIELWPLLKGLGIYRGGYYDFAARYAKMWNAPWGLDVSRASNLPELKALMKPNVLRRKKEDVFKDYKQPQVSLITFDLPVDKREKNFDADALVENPNAIMAIEGLSEIMLEAGLQKIKPAAEFIEDKLAEGEPLIVFVHHKEVARLLAEELKKYKPRTITGETSDKNRTLAISAFQEGETNLIIGNIAAMSEGIDLSRADTVIFVEATWQTSALEQATSRMENVVKSGFTPLVYLLTIKASLDHNVLGKVLRKLSIIDQII
jgi:SWI/SNF-related matrix-associated actin-dependent regulator of chromatin subfamily A-like protein 1